MPTSFNERDYLSEGKSFQQDPSPEVIKKKMGYRVVVLALVAFLFITGLIIGTSFSARRRYTRSSLTTTSIGGGGIRSSATMDASLSSSVDLKYGSGFDKCEPASGSFDRLKDRQNNDKSQNPFQSCYREKDTGEHCWSKSYYHDGWFSGWSMCMPQGHRWYYMPANEVKPDGTCGKPCQDMYESE